MQVAQTHTGTHTGTHTAHAESHGHHVLSLNMILTVGGLLLVMTAVTVFVAQFDFGAMNMVVAMVVATFKATLVVAYFMQLRYDNKFFFVMLMVSLIALMVFIVFTMIDQKSRTGIYDKQMQEIRKNAKMYEKKPAAPAAPAKADEKK
jgi:cytochrome c oxidase subunit IV